MRRSGQYRRKHYEIHADATGVLQLLCRVAGGCHPLFAPQGTILERHQRRTGKVYTRSAKFLGKHGRGIQ